MDRVRKERIRKRGHVDEFKRKLRQSLFGHLTSWGRAMWTKNEAVNILENEKTYYKVEGSSDCGPRGSWVQ